MISDPQIIKDAITRVLDENPKELASYKEVSQLSVRVHEHEQNELQLRNVCKVLTIENLCL